MIVLRVRIRREWHCDGAEFNKTQPFRPAVLICVPGCDHFMQPGLLFSCQLQFSCQRLLHSRHPTETDRAEPELGLDWPGVSKHVFVKDRRTIGRRISEMRVLFIGFADDQTSWKSLLRDHRHWQACWLQTQELLECIHEISLSIGCSIGSCTDKIILFRVSSCWPSSLRWTSMPSKAHSSSAKCITYLQSMRTIFACWSKRQYTWLTRTGAEYSSTRCRKNKLYLGPFVISNRGIRVSFCKRHQVRVVDFYSSTRLLSGRQIFRCRI
jgi:hypothetical protein